MTLSWNEACPQLEALIEAARQKGVYEPTRAVLTTQDSEGRPASRVVLLKQVNSAGIVFYTNAQSRKAAQIFQNPNCALCFSWRPDMQTFYVAGPVEGIAAADSDAYWIQRPRMSQIGAWASKQSRRLPSRALFWFRIAAYTCFFLGRPVPRPPFWRGFLLRVQSIELRPGS